MKKYIQSKLIIARFCSFVRSFVRPSVRHTLTEKAEESRKWLARQLAASHLTSAAHWTNNFGCSLANIHQLLIGQHNISSSTVYGPTEINCSFVNRYQLLIGQLILGTH